MIKRALLTAFAFGVINIAAADRDADDKVLYFDNDPKGIKHLKFDQFDPLIPRINNFEIIEISYLSNNRGERWALMTLKNESAGQRILKNDNVVATFADGSQRFATQLGEKFSGSEVLTRAVFFGVHRFPIVKVSVD